MMVHEENCRWLWAAYKQAQQSPDPSTQVGAIIIDANGEVVSSAYNAPVVLGLESILPKTIYMEHAERAAIYEAARRGLATTGLTMICTWASCVECARAIVASGIRTVVRHGDLIKKTPCRWYESINAGNKIFEAGGIEIIEIFGKINAPTIRFDSLPWAP